ncbi:MAG TPA: OmpH family outer membrane protein [Saprospiraceae bacterium]|nr:OmpH family outer membrane protein [Saprospiraceae bacterium]
MRSIFLLLLITILFSCNNKKTEAPKKETVTTVAKSDSLNEPTVEPAAAPAELKIAYVQIDTVLEHYSFYKQIKGNLTAKGKKVQLEVQTRTKEMAVEYQSYQAKGETMSPKQLQEAELSLRKKDQDLKAYQEQKSNELMKEEETLNKQLQKKIDNFLVGYAKEHGYTYILSKHSGGSVLYGAKDLDVTKDVTDGLNALNKK